MCLIFLVLLNLFVSYKNVQIFETPTPFFLMSGDTLALRCFDETNIDLVWYRRTKLSNNSQSIIVPSYEKNFEIHKTTIYPKMSVQTTLIYRKLSLDDAGVYLCSDLLKYYMSAIWLTVIDIVPSKNLTINYFTSSVRLTCQIIGLETNLSLVSYFWTFNGQVISNPQDRFISMDYHPNNTFSIIIKPNIDTNVTGVYECVYKLHTSYGLAIFSKPIFFKVKHQLFAEVQTIKAKLKKIDKKRLSQIYFLHALFLLKPVCEYPFTIDYRKILKIDISRCTALIYIIDTTYTATIPRKQKRHTSKSKYGSNQMKS
ncbi:hypothetical protein A3Q56_05545, partial [Intoshia linei]